MTQKPRKQTRKRAWLSACALMMRLSLPFTLPLNSLFSDTSLWDDEAFRPFLQGSPEDPKIDTYDWSESSSEEDEAFAPAPEIPQAVSRLDDEQRIVETLDIVFTDRDETTAVLKQKVITRLKTIAGRYFSQADFDQDLKMLVQDYDHVEPTLRREGDRIHLTLRIWPKPSIRDITWVGNNRFPTKTLQDQLDITVKSRFERMAFHKAFQKVKAFYIKKGFFESQLNYTIAFHEESNEVSITIEINEGRSGKIEEILFSGFTAKEEREITLNMITKRYREFVSWVMGDGIYDQDAMKMDEFRILEYLHNRGYADAKVDIEVRQSRFNNRIDVNINAEKGAQYHVGTVKVEGLDGTSILSEEEAQNCMRVRTGSIYSLEKIRETITRLQNAYGRHGYIDALVDLDTKLNSAECTYDLKFTVSPGEKFRIGLVRVVGNVCTQTRVILHENLLIPGEMFNLDLLRITEMRLFNIGYFKNVNIYPVESEEVSEDGSAVRDVVIEVEETGTGNFSAFGGYSTTESLFCGITITETNFDHNGLFCARKKGLCALRGGGEYLSLTTNLGLKTNSVQLSWTQPHFNDTPWSVGFDVDRTNNGTLSDDYEIRSLGGSVHATYPLTAFLRWSTHYRVQNSVVALTGRGRKHSRRNKRLAAEKGIPLPDKTKIKKEKPKLTKAQKDYYNSNCYTPPIESAQRKDGLISAIGTGWIYDSTDSPVCPTRGARTRLDAEFVGLGGKYHFYSFAWINTYYQPISERGTLKLRADLNFIKPFGSTQPNDVPLDERLFLGGDNGVRGYRPFAIGPKFNTGEPRGGLSMQLLSAEYNYRFPIFDAFLFYDAGALSAEVWHFDRLSTSAGFGIRAQVLPQAPPVTLGVGFPINPRCRSDVKRFFWSMGGRF